MPDQRGLENIKAIVSRKTTKKPPAYEWQDLALRVIAELGIPDFKKNSVFRIAKTRPKPFVEKCLNDTKELCKTGETWRYFFKLCSGERASDKKFKT
jgi:hypothetical protein